MSRDDRSRRPLILSLSKDEPLRSWFDRPAMSELVLRQAQDERVEGLTTREMLKRDARSRQ
jgi:hypothetical protein